MGKALGDPHQLRSAARSWGDEASTYNTQVTSLTRVQNKLPESAFTGAKGTQMRAWLSDTLRTTSTLRSAYSRIADAAPFVADAIQDSKRAEKKKDDAQLDEQDARRTYSAAANDVIQAQTALNNATKLAAAHHAHGGGDGGAVARARQDLETAQKRLDKAEKDLKAKEKAYTTASDDFTDAKDAQKRKSDAFAKLLHDQTVIINKTLPSAPPAPAVSPVLSQLTVLGYGRQAIKGLLDVQKNVIRTHYGVPERVSLNELRKIRANSGESLTRLAQIRLNHRGGAFGPLTESQSKALTQIEKWGGRLSKLNNAVALGTTFAGNTLKALHDPNLSAQEKQDQIFNHTLLEFGGGYAGGALCAPGGIVASAACGYAGSQAGKLLESSSLVRRATNGYSHIVLNPEIEPIRDLANGHIGEFAKDAALAPVRVPYNLVTQTFPTPKRIAHVAGDAAHDAKGVRDFLDDQADNFFGGLSRGLRGGH